MLFVERPEYSLGNLCISLYVHNILVRKTQLSPFFFFENEAKVLSSCRNSLNLNLHLAESKTHSVSTLSGSHIFPRNTS